MPRRVVNVNLDLDIPDMDMKFQCKHYEDVELRIKLHSNDQLMNLDLYTIDFLTDNDDLETTIEVEEDVVIIKFLAELTPNKRYKAELVITDNEGTLKTPTFFFCVKKSLEV